MSYSVFLPSSIEVFFGRHFLAATAFFARAILSSVVIAALCAFARREANILSNSGHV